jgi:prepilin-type N-terminal cleavage/methylation domain-containing protein
MNTNRKLRKQKGFTLIETMVAMVIMSVGILSIAAVYTQGLRAAYKSQIQFIAQQKALAAMETIFTARDTSILTWAQINNVSQGGVFKDGPQPLLASGPDGLYGTADDDANNPDVIVLGPGPDQILGTADDTVTNLNPWMTRTILITPVNNTPNLNMITVTVQYNFQSQVGQFQVVCYISNYA